MRKQTGLLAGTTLLFIASVIIFTGRLATSVVVARTLGPELKGIYNLTLLTSGLVIIISNLGLNEAISFFTASKKYNGRQIFVFALLAGLILSIIGGILFYLAYNSYLVKNILAGINRRLIVWIMLGLPLSLIPSFLSSLLLGQQKIVAYNSVNIFRVLTNLTLQIISSVISGGVAGAVISWLAANGLAMLLALWLLKQEINLQINDLPPILPSLLSYGGKSYLANLLTFFNYRLDSFLVNYFQGTAAVGQYTTSVSMAELLWYLPNAVSGALFPKVSSLDENTANRLTPQASRQTLLVVVIITGIMSVVGASLILAFYGEAFRPAVKPFMWLLPGMIGITISKIISADLSGRGKPRYAAYTAGFTIISTLVLDISLIPRYSISGAAIASSIAYIFSGGLSILWFYRETRIVPAVLLIPTMDDVHFLIQRGRGIALGLIHRIAARRGNL